MLEYVKLSSHSYTNGYVWIVKMQQQEPNCLKHKDDQKTPKCKYWETCKENCITSCECVNECCEPMTDKGCMRTQWNAFALLLNLRRKVYLAAIDVFRIH